MREKEEDITLPVSDLMELYSYLDAEYSVSHPTPLHVYVVIPKVTVQELPKIAQARKKGIKIRSTDSPKLYEVTLSLRNRHVSGWLISQQAYWLFLIRPMESPPDAGRIAENWIERMFPAVSFGRISVNHLVDVIQSIKELDNAKLDIVSIILRKEGESKLRHPTSKNWEGHAPFNKDNVLATALQLNRVVDEIRFVLSLDKERIFECTLSRSGHFVFYGGNSSGFSEFLRVAVSRVVTHAQEELKEFKGLESRPETGYEVSTLSYQTEEGDRIDQEVDNLTRSLIKNSSYAVSLNHSGNPWFSISAVDRDDGSGYELNLFKHRLDIVFSTRAEPESVSRLTSIIDGVLPKAKRGAPEVS